MKRRLFCWAWLLPWAVSAQAPTEAWTQALRPELGLPKWPALKHWQTHPRLSHTGLRLEMEHIADNGNSVPLRLCCEALPAQEHLRQLHLISERNPRPEIFKLEFLQPLNTLDLSTRIRLAGTQNLIALAETNQGRVLWVSHHISVTDSACVEGA